MKKNFLIGGSVFITFIVVCVLALFVHGAKVAYGQASFGVQAQQLIDALKVQENYRSTTGDNAEVDADTQSIVSDSQLLAQKSGAITNAYYPSKFDLREADLDGNGAVKNYVTSVKFQNPWGSCWAFAGTAASEISILSELRQNAFTTDASGNKHDNLDLSEHHLAWFNYSPMQAFETATQAGEGAYSVTEENALKEGKEFWLSQRMATGGVCMSTNSSYAMGMGVVLEPDFNDTNVSPVIKQLLYKGAQGKIQERARGNCFSADDDWSIDYSARFMQDFKLENGFILPDAKGPADEPYDINNAKMVTKLMKEQLMNGRALNIAFKADNYSPTQEGRVPKYINVETWAHYTYDKTGASHDVTVVGWDDNYPSTNFLSEVPETDEEGHIIIDPGTGQPIMKSVPQPPENGAWIVKNSWGSTDSWGQGLNNNIWGDHGYFYMSYYDQSLKSEEAYDFDVTGTSADAVVTNQYDFMPCEAAKAIEQSASVTTANVFTSPVAQDITELGTITSTEAETVTFQLYKLNSADQRIDTGQLLWTGTEYYDYKGYHRVRIGQAFHMNEGEVFAITKTEQSGNKYLMGVASDANRTGYDAGKAGDNYYCIGIVNPGESFVYTSSDDTWTDFSLMKKELESIAPSYYTYDNFPLKAYGVPSENIYPTEETFDIAQTSDNTSAITLCMLIVFALGLTAFMNLKKDTFYTLAG